MAPQRLCGALALHALATMSVRPAAATVSFSEGVLSTRVRSNIEAVMEEPFSPLDFTTDAHRLGFLDLSSTLELQQWVYGQALATHTGDGTQSSIDMLYVGLEDGRFLGYFSPTSYTYRGPGTGGPEAAGLGWAPYTLATVDCDLIRCHSGSTVSASCAANVNAGEAYDGECKDLRSGSTDAAFSDQVACEIAENIWFAPCTTDKCCDSSIRNYYSTSEVALGAPIDVTRWRVYDHRIRQWYREAISAWTLAEPGDKRLSTWSSVYPFISAGTLGLTAMQTVFQADGTTPEAVFAVDFTLSMISTVVEESLAGSDRSFAYLVETLPGVSGLLIGASSLEPLTDNTGARLSAVASAHPHIRASAAVLAGMGWTTIAGEVCASNIVSTASAVYRAGGGSVGWEIHTQCTRGDVYHGLSWLVVTGQEIACNDKQIWMSRDGRCEACPAGTQPKPVADRRQSWETETAGTGVTWEVWLQSNPHECMDCDMGGLRPGWAGNDGSCKQCEDGSKPNELSTNCERCAQHSAGVGGECRVCTQNDGLQSSDDFTSCVCPAGTYDSWRPLLAANPALAEETWNSTAGPDDPYHIFCWDDDKNFARSSDLTWLKIYKGYPESDWCDEVTVLPDPGQGSASANYLSSEDLKVLSGKRCITCPKCVDCGGKDGHNVSITEGYAMLGLSLSGQDSGYDNDLDIFKCETGACEGFKLIPGTNTSGWLYQAPGVAGESSRCKDPIRSGPLCTLCAESYTKKTGGTCEECDQVNPRTKWTLGVMGGLLLLSPFLWKYLLNKTVKGRIALFLGTAERSWPRIRQSLNIMIANYQISKRIARNSGIEWGPDMMMFYEKVGSMADLDLLAIPGISCISGDSFYMRWVIKMLIMPAW